MAGIKVTRTKKGAILEVPIRGRPPQKFYTSLSVMIKFIKGEYEVIYFNPKSDFATYPVKEERNG